MRTVEKQAVSDETRLAEALLEVFRTLDFEEQLRRIVGTAARWTGASFGIALGSLPGRRKFTPLAGTEPDDDPRMRAFHGIEPRTVRGLGDRPVVRVGWGEFAEAVREWPESTPPHTLLAPVHDGVGELWGVVCLAIERPPAAETIRALERFLERTRDAVGHAQHVIGLRELIIKDDTASCFNRRYFEEFLPEELARAARFRSPLSLIFLDMDNLKQVNNRHGHSMGSRTLYEVSVRVRGKIRKFDKLFRFGGDEFCIVLPETEWHGAVEVAERVRDVIASENLLVREVGDGVGVPMTASLGVASYPLHARDRRELVQRADRAMQRIKATGKNGIGVAERADRRTEATGGANDGEPQGDRDGA